MNTMSFTKCTYLACENNSRKNPELSFFRFPINHESRLKLWIQNSGNILLNSLTNYELRYRSICAAHFPQSRVHRGKNGGRLLGPAVPYHYQFTLTETASTASTNTHEDVEIKAPVSPEVLKVNIPTKFYERKNRQNHEQKSKNSTPSSSSTREQYKMEDDIDIEEHDLWNDPALRSVLPDLVILKREIQDFDIGQDTPIKTENPTKNENENQLDSALEVNSGNPPLVCFTQDLDVKPDILCTDIDDTLTVVKNLSESEIEYSHIKKESEIVESNELPFYRNRIILGKVNEYKNEYKTYSEPVVIKTDEERIKTDEERCKSITKQYYEDKCLQAKVLLSDCYLSLLENKCYCAQCAILFPSTKAYSEHNMSTHPDSSKSTKASAALLEPKKFILTDDKLYQCSTCKKTFRYRSSLNRHKSIHTGEKPFECTMCKKTFRLRIKLNKHNFIHTGEKPYECLTCKKKFRFGSSLYKHKSIHTGEKPFECTICKKTFRQRCNLNKHNFIHTGVKPYECTTCKKRFGRLNHLNRHKFTHTGENPYECKTCKETFRRHSNFIKHKLNNCEKPYQCITCKKRFWRQSDLTKHNLIHISEKPFECATCKKRFGRSSILKHHEFIHTGEKPYECNTCKETFRQRGQLIKHTFIFHTTVKL